MIEGHSMKDGWGRWLLGGVCCVIRDTRANSPSGPAPMVLRAPGHPEKIGYRP